MPLTLTYPGVYIEELPSGVHTISGVATSIAAFVGWAARGPIDKAGLVLSWSDFERIYGGIDPRSLLGYSVNHFFKNGGNQCYIVRLAANAQAGSVTIDGKLECTAQNPGNWAHNYTVSTKQRPNPDQNHFSVTISYIDPQSHKESIVESFENLTLDPADTRFAEAIINDESRIVIVKKLIPAGNTSAPSDTPSTLLDNNISGEYGDVLDPLVDENTFHAALTPGVHLLDRVDLFNLLCVPGETNTTTLQELQKYCRDHRAFLIADCADGADFTALKDGPGSTLTQDDSINSAFYFPWLKAPDPAQSNKPRLFPPCGFIAGIYAKTDANRGVYKAPAGVEASLTGITELAHTLTDDENGNLNIQGINCIRNFKSYGNVVWGARTLRGSNDVGSEWKYIPVRRTALFIEESLYRGTQWVVFEPNDEPLWSQIRLNLGAFMHSLFRQGAFQGKTPNEAYFVKCDKETTTQDDINRGIVNIIVGFAPLKPAEFVVIKIQQIAGQIES